MTRTYDLESLHEMLQDHHQYTINEYESQKDGKLFVGDLKNITAPTLIIYGAKDPVILPKQALEYHEAIGNSRFYILYLYPS